MNPTNEKRLVGLHPIFAGRVRQLLDHMDSLGVPCLIVQGLRTWAEQDALYAQGRTKPGEVVTKAPGGHSQHNFGLAVDLCPEVGGKLDWNVKHPDWHAMLAAGKEFKLAEGAEWRTFPDNPHFYPVEIPATCTELRAVYAAKGLPGVWGWFEGLVKF